MKTATTIDEQISKLKNRGMAISDEAKAKEILSDIGYYRLGFYWFPFEYGYPKKTRRKHGFIKGTRFEDAVCLYYFDNDLRNTLIPYLHRIEVSFRTSVIYIVSNHYRHNPTWFADPKVVEPGFIKDLPNFYKDIRKNEAVKRHHLKYINDIYAPAWKTLEYMTFGNMLYLFENLKDDSLKESVRAKFNVLSLDAFLSQMKTIRTIRNVCAHGHNLFDLKFHTPIKVGGLKGLDARQRSTISGGLIVIASILKSISENRSNDLISQINNLLTKKDFVTIQPVIRHISMVPAKLPPDRK
jgi:abortive infection bacteriophage resistance protein